MKKPVSTERLAPVVYLAGPIAGCSWDAAVDWRDWVGNQLPECDVRSPMRGKEFLKALHEMPGSTEGLEEVLHLAKRGVDAAVSSQHAIVVRDHWDVNAADALVVNLLPSLDIGTASIGTCFELAWAWKYQKPAIVAMQDGNPNSHPFVREAAYIVVPTLEEAVYVARQLLNLPPNKRGGLPPGRDK